VVQVSVGAAIFLAMLSAQVVMMTFYFARKAVGNNFWDVVGTICLCMNSFFIVALMWRPQ